MEISILLNILLMIISIGRLFFQAAKITPITAKKINQNICRSHEAEKLVMRGLYLLNTVTSSNSLKATQTTLIQSQNIKLVG